jgi:hypothetical protein
LATHASAFGTVLEFRTPAGGAFPVATNGVLPTQVRFGGERVPESLRGAFIATVTFARQIAAADIGGARPFTDHQNSFSFAFARAEMAHRQMWAQRLPPGLLVN